MTKVQLTFKLSRALNDQDLDNISRVHSVYGFYLVRPRPAGDELFVEYDASRLRPADIRQTLGEHGLPIV